MTSEFIMIWVTVAASIAAIASAIAAGRTLKMAKLSAEPVVVFDLEWDERNDQVYVVVKNIGQSPAFYISLESTPELSVGPDQAGNRAPIRWGSFAEGIGNLYPGMSRSIGWTTRRLVNNDLLNTRYIVKSTYFVDGGIKQKEKHKRITGTQLAYDMLPIEGGLVKTVRDGLGGCKRSIENLPRIQGN
ncbi:MAG: hypothetical protein AB8C13_05315 [Phycisphaerales bacterium]